MLSAMREWWNQIHLLVDTMRSHVTRRSAQPAYCLRPQCSRPGIVNDPPARAIITGARNTLASGDSIFFRGADCCIIHRLWMWTPRASFDVELAVELNIRVGDKLRRKAELFGPVTLPNAVHVLSCNELHQKNYFRTLSWKNTCDFTASCRYARG